MSEYLSHQGFLNNVRPCLCLGRRLRRISAKKAKKSCQTACGGRAFDSRAQRDKRANELGAAKTREARGEPRSAYLQPASAYHGPKQALSRVLFLCSITHFTNIDAT